MIKQYGADECMLVPNPYSSNSDRAYVTRRDILNYERVKYAERQIERLTENNPVTVEHFLVAVMNIMNNQVHPVK